MNWEPIETAPKDGADVLTFDGKKIRLACWDAAFDSTWEDDGPVMIAAWTDHSVQSWNYEEYQSHVPTHWMPLPEPPKP